LEAGRKLKGSWNKAGSWNKVKLDVGT